MILLIQLKNFFKSHNYLYHLIFIVIFFIKIFFHLSYVDLLHVIVIVFVLIPPGLFLLDSFKAIKFSFSLMLGCALGIGFILQGVLYFIMIIGDLQAYYKYVAFLLSVISLITLFFSREYIINTIKESKFDVVDLILYIGLFLGIGLYSSTYGNLFDSRVTEGIIKTPLLEVHSLGFMNYALNYSEYPFYSIFGWPMIPVEIPQKIPHLPMPGFLVKSLSMWCDGNLLFSLYLTHLFAIISLVSATFVICFHLFNRYAALLVSVAFSLPIMPIGNSYLLYLPVLLSLMGAALFILITFDQDKISSGMDLRQITLMCILFIFLMLVHNQFLLVFSATLLVYLLYVTIQNGLIKTLKLYIVPGIFLLFTFYYLLQQYKTLYPSLYFSKWDTRRVVLELDFFRNIGYIYPDIAKDIKSLIKTIFRYDFLLIILGILSILNRFCSFRSVINKTAYVFVISGIIISLIFGNIFYFEAGVSSIYFLSFGLYFLMFYGGELLSRNRVITLSLTCIIIIGYLIFPQFYKHNFHGNGFISKESYTDFRKIAEILPMDSKILLVSEKYDNLYIGYEKDELKLLDKRTQRACENITGHRCAFQHFIENNEKSQFNESIIKKITTYKLTHIVMSNMDIQNHLDSNIKIFNKKVVTVSRNKKFYVAELEYNKHF